MRVTSERLLEIDGKMGNHKGDIANRIPTEAGGHKNPFLEAVRAYVVKVDSKAAPAAIETAAEKLSKAILEGKHMSPMIAKSFIQTLQKATAS